MSGIINTTSFYSMCKSGDIESVKQLFGAADPNESCNEIVRVIAFMMACGNHQFELADYLTEIFDATVIFKQLSTRLVDLCTDYAIFDYVNEWTTKNLKMDLRYCINCGHNRDTCPNCNKIYHANLKKLYTDLKTNYTYAHPYAMKLIVTYADLLVKTYQLSECDTLVSETSEWVDKNLSKSDWWYLQYIQSVAVLRYKQGRYMDCAKQYEIVLEIVGPNYAIYENLAHTYNNAGKTKKAAECIEKAINFSESNQLRALNTAKINALKEIISAEMDQPDLTILEKYESATSDEEKQAILNEADKLMKDILVKYDKEKETVMTTFDKQKAGLYLALSVNKSANGDVTGALAQALKSVQIYDSTGDNVPVEYPTLSAKARMSVGKYYEQLRDYVNAEKYFSEAVQTFTKTVGKNSPLTADALQHHGSVLVLLDRLSDAEQALTNALASFNGCDKASQNKDRMNSILIQLNSVQTRINTLSKKSRKSARK